MRQHPFETGAQLRRRLLLAISAVGFSAALIVALYLAVLLRMDATAWRHFGIAVGVFVVLYPIFGQWLQRRFEGPAVRCIDRQRLGLASTEDVQAGFAAVMWLPAGLCIQGGIAWILAALFVPGWMAFWLGQWNQIASLVIAAAALSGGFVASTFVYFAVKRVLAPLRDSWALEIEDPEVRAGLVRRVPLAWKLAVPPIGLVSAAIAFTLLFGYTNSLRPVEAHAARIQQSFLRQAARAFAAGDPAALATVREEGRELGCLSELFLFDPAKAVIVEGAAEAIGAAERRWIAASGHLEGDSRGLDSDRVFSWMPAPGAPGLLLVAALEGRGLAGEIQGMRPAVAGLFVLSVLIALITSGLLADDVTRGATALRAQADRIASGDLASSGGMESEDEIGELARAFERMGRSLREMIGRVASTADRVDAASAQLATVGTRIAAAATEQTSGLESATASMASINRQVSGITESAHVLNGNLEEASSSVLELGAAGEELSQTASALGGQIEEVSGSIEQMIRSARHIAENTEGLGGAVVDTAASMAEMAASMEQVDATSNATAALSAQVVRLADGGRESVRRTIAGMDEIRDATDTVRGVMTSLGSRVEEIGAIVDVIDEVADETNLLALNAAIIAAQAGEQGRAFSVVADEIKDLADRVLSSTKEIGGLIRSVQAESANASRAIEQGAERVQSGVDLSAEAGVSLEEINAAARDSGGRIQEIGHAVREQAQASARVAQLMGRVNAQLDEIRTAGREQERGNDVVLRSSLAMREVAQQTRRTTEEQARGAARIRDSVESVRDAVDRIHAALQEQSEACRQAVSFLGDVHAHTRSNHESAGQLGDATHELRAHAEALRADVRRFQI